MSNYTFKEMTEVFEAGYYQLFWAVYFSLKYAQQDLYKELQKYLDQKQELSWIKLPHYSYKGSFTAYNAQTNTFEVIFDDVTESEINGAFPNWETHGSFKGTLSCEVTIPAEDMVLFDVGDISHYSIFWIRIQK